MDSSSFLRTPVLKKCLQTTAIEQKVIMYIKAWEKIAAAKLF
jgi:hypothetical protein